MKRIILIYGALSGAIIIGSMIIGINAASSQEEVVFPEWLGYLIMFAALTLIFLGIKKHRDESLGGVIQFKKALTVGLGITVLASVIYVIAWEVNLAVTDYAFMDEYTEYMIREREEQGMTGEEFEAFKAEMEVMKERYENPLFRVPITFLEIFPVGLLVSLIAAALLRKSSFLPARQPA